MRVCRVCGQALPDDQFASHGSRLDGRRKFRTTCKECYNRHERDRARLKRADRPIKQLHKDGPVGDPVRFLLVATLERALRDLDAFGKPRNSRKGGALEEGVSQDPAGCDYDAQDALQWLRDWGEDWCELLDLPREWAPQAVEERMEARA